ncbi:hypothetical protein F5Y05DRAFT_420487 [Hypoxylon sp. FL0543]|nr:hypothetical protein F5Y05DRAFT_420487 [Hypoxylon sp. FL0543]
MANPPGPSQSPAQAEVGIFPSVKIYPDNEIETDDESSSLNFSIPSWQEEYFYCGICLATACLLLNLMYFFDGKLEPEWNDNLKFSTIIVAVMSCFRLALKAVIESCISQGAWIWVSGFRKGKVEARLEDFKLFSEAATGI